METTGPKPLFLGIDGGGTKTDVLLAGADGVPVRRLRLGGGNISSLGEDRSTAFLADAIAAASEGLPPPAGAFLGLAGAIADGIGARVEARLRARFPALPIEVGPDIRCVIEAAEADGGCVAAILGTGSCVHADDGRALYRYGGWGENRFEDCVFVDSAGGFQFWEHPDAFFERCVFGPTEYASIAFLRGVTLTNCCW